MLRIDKKLKKTGTKEEDMKKKAPSKITGQLQPEMGSQEKERGLLK
jgi:hypothetical protein